MSELGIGPTWDELYETGANAVWEKSVSFSRYTAFLPSTAPRTLLDIGCGGDDTIYQAIELDFDVTGVDVSEKAIALSSLRKSRYDNSKITLTHLDIEKVDLNNVFDQFGIVHIKKLFGFIEDKERFTSQVVNLVDKDGIVVMTNHMVRGVTSGGKLSGVPGSITDQEYYLFTDKFEEIESFESGIVRTYIGRQKTRMQ